MQEFTFELEFEKGHVVQVGIQAYSEKEALDIAASFKGKQVYDKEKIVINHDLVTVIRAPSGKADEGNEER
ncbi:hypothetical protein [Alkalicoccus luteus]|uniref:Uncharacterized protein n=1 Tax=Alkalicoccus luteus TaxID=1237094 RepID=A0A969TVF2_9BACI|nr:hypothetical protein [Alkalicoccus luteus]NJP37941.1 hypothetical protein [Alkalicoccus luteus]